MPRPPSRLRLQRMPRRYSCDEDYTTSRVASVLQTESTLLAVDLISSPVDDRLSPLHASTRQRLKSMNGSCPSPAVHRPATIAGFFSSLCSERAGTLRRAVSAD